jgi:hypothetical protein
MRQQLLQARTAGNMAEVNSLEGQPAIGLLYLLLVRVLAHA